MRVRAQVQAQVRDDGGGGVPGLLVPACGVRLLPACCPPCD